MAYIDARKSRWGVQPICKVLHFAPSTYYAATTRAPSNRSVADEELKPKIEDVYEDNLSVYGARKIWAELKRQGTKVARCTVERLMGDIGIVGVSKSKSAVRTTIADELADRPQDLVRRNFTADRPNELWVADITYIDTAINKTYVAFVIDVFSRKVVGWKVSSSLKTDLATDALDMAIYQRNYLDNLDNLVHHSDRGSQYLSIKYSQRLQDYGIAPSVGSKGDSYDNALAESFNGLYKAELIRRKKSWKNVQDVEWATLLYIDWFNNRRIHSKLGMIPPVEYEAIYYAKKQACEPIGSQG